MKLAQIEIQSAVWQKVSKELTERLEVLRQQNDGDRGAIETAHIRGKIAAIKMMLDWEKPDPAIQTHD